MARTSYRHSFKILLVGDSDVGKSILLSRFEDNERRDYPFVSTIGVPFRVRDVRVGGRAVRLQLWDAGWAALHTHHSQATHGILLVYDVTKETSFENARAWLQRVRGEGGAEGVVVMLLANNSHNQGDQRQVMWERGKKAAQEAGVMFLEVSAVTGANTELTLTTITKAILAKEASVVDTKPILSSCTVQ